LRSEKEYELGDEIWLSAYVKPAREKFIPIYDLFNQRQSLQSHSFSNFNQDNLVAGLSGALAYEFDYSKRLMMKHLYGVIYEQNSFFIASNPSTLQKVKASLQSKVVKAYGENKVSGLIL